MVLKGLYQVISLASKHVLEKTSSQKEKIIPSSVFEKKMRATFELQMKMGDHLFISPRVIFIG